MTLRELRSKRGLTQRELALRSGISQSNIAKFEAGISDVDNMTLRTAVKLCDVLKVKDLRELLEP